MISTPFRRLLLSLRSCVNFVEFNVYYGLDSYKSSYRPLSYISHSTTKINYSRYFCSKSLPFNDFDSDFENEGGIPVFKKPNKREAIETLSHGIGCSETEAAKILKEFPKLKSLTTKDIENKIEFYVSLGIKITDIVQNPWILWYKLSVIEEKLKLTNAMKMEDPRSSLSLLSVPLKRLKELQSWSDNDINSTGVSKIEFISEKLKCNRADLVYSLSIHRFVERLPYERLTTIIDVLLEGGAIPEDILKDIWVVRYSKEQVSDRIRRAKEGGIVQFKTWMVRCPEKTFNNTLRRQSEKQTLLGPHQYSAIQYISSRLGVSHEEAKLILTRHPQLRGVGAAKLCNTLDFLLGKEEKNLNESELCNAKFNRVQVWNSIRALCHSLETMKERLIRLRALGYEPYTPSILYKSRKKFEEFVKKLEEKASQNQSGDITSGLESGTKK